MRDFRDAKAMAKTIRAVLVAKGLKVTVSESLELIAKAFGTADWNTLAAAIKTAEAAPDQPAKPPFDNNRMLDGLAKALGVADWDRLADIVRASRPATIPPGETQQRGAPIELLGHAGFSNKLEATLRRAVGESSKRRHGYTTLEHLLLALTDDLDASTVLEACQVDLGSLRATLTSYIDNDLKRLTAMGEADHPVPTAGFHRVIQRALMHVVASGRADVTGANVLVAIFSEQESHAAYFLRQREMTRLDAVNFIAHGIRKDGGRAA